MSRLSVVAAFALMLATLACNPKSLKPGYCNTSTDCKADETCNTGTRKCERKTDGSAEHAEAGVDSGSDAMDARDASDVVEVPPPTCRTQPMLCADGGFDGSPGVCEVDAGICVQCLTNSDCSQNSKTPICETHLCRACKADAECPDPTICMADGHCATVGEVVFVEFDSNGCPGANGSSASPYCTPNEGVARLTSGQNVLVIRGATADRLTLNTSGVAPVVIGKTGASIPATAATAIQVLSDSVLIRDVAVTGGTAAGSKGIVTSGSSTTLSLLKVQVNVGTGLGVQADGGAALTMDRCTVTSNTAGGLLINGANYDIQNSVFAANGFSQLQFSATVSVTARFRFNTVVAITGNAATCDITNKAALSDSIVIGGQNCTLVNSFTNATFNAALPYHLTAPIGCPLVPTAPWPDHDIDGEPRTTPLDCGADQFQ